MVKIPKLKIPSRGVVLKSRGPVANVCRTLGIPRRELARRLGVNYQTAANWDRTDRALPAYVQAALTGILRSHRAEVAEASRRNRH